jgi:hypothetical protein
MRQRYLLPGYPAKNSSSPTKALKHDNGASRLTPDNQLLVSGKRFPETGNSLWTSPVGSR